MANQTKQVTEGTTHLGKSERYVIEALEGQLTYYIEALHEERVRRSQLEKKVQDLEYQTVTSRRVTKLLLSTSEELEKERKMKTNYENKISDLKSQMTDICGILDKESDSRNNAEKRLEEMEEEMKSYVQVKEELSAERERRIKAEEKVEEMKTEVHLLARQLEQFQNAQMHALYWRRQYDLSQYRDQFEACEECDDDGNNVDDNDDGYDVCDSLENNKDETSGVDDVD